MKRVEPLINLVSCLTLFEFYFFFRVYGVRNDLSLMFSEVFINCIYVYVGKAIQLTHVVPTLKANIRAQKREQFNKSQHHDKVQEDSGESKFIDSRLSVKPPVRTKRALRFHEPGKFQQMAERLRMKVSGHTILR